MIQLYVILGSAGSGRREVVADLVETSLAGSHVLLAATEAAAPTDARLEAKAQVLRWSFDGEALCISELPAECETLIMLLDGTADPVVQLELLVEWLASHKDVELARIITVLNSRLLYETPNLKLWFDACIHFSDVVLFNKREDVPNKWFSDFTARFAKACYPCMFEYVKNGHVRNPAQVVFPEALRMSLAFEPVDEKAAPDNADFLAESFDLGDDADEELDDIENAGDEIEEPAVEPYFERDLSGRYKIRLPDIGDYVK
ncbi:MAG: hypothetical protein JW942_04005 [Opitutales bacterium]|nr:hypothetical protein [Opitutales bacterium]